jgi:hypothetical protein
MYTDNRKRIVIVSLIPLMIMPYSIVMVGVAIIVAAALTILWESRK